MSFGCKEHPGRECSGCGDCFEEGDRETMQDLKGIEEDRKYDEDRDERRYI